MVQDFYKARHHTCAVSHSAKMVGNGIAACNIAIPENYLEVYQNMLNGGDTKVKARKQVREE